MTTGGSRKDQPIMGYEKAAIEAAFDVTWGTKREAIAEAWRSYGEAVKAARIAYYAAVNAAESAYREAAEPAQSAYEAARDALDLNTENDRLRRQNGELLGALEMLLAHLVPHWGKDAVWDAMFESNDTERVRVLKTARAAIVRARENEARQLERTEEQ